MAADRQTSPDVRRLAALGLSGGPSCEEALRVFARARSTPDEGAAIEALVGGRATTALPEPLLIAIGSALIDRGQEEAAARLLSSATSSPALIMRSDLLARAGDLPMAIAFVERVLSRDIDWPGGRDRHSRLREALGIAGTPRRSDQPTTVVTATPEAPFRLLREVGRGGTGAVYEAEDRYLGRHVALKMYHHLDRDRTQLLHEARVAAALAGPGIVRVFDLDPDHGWVAMEWARLGTLRAALQQSSCWSRPEQWATPLARAIARVHAAGWTHHDVKPANVLLLASGTPMLSDFGAARRLGEPNPPGSLGYVSPERLAGRRSNARDDVYAFGRVLEDALESFGELADAHPWRQLAAACTGSDESRPKDGGEVLLVLNKMRGY